MLLDAEKVNTSPIRHDEGIPPSTIRIDKWSKHSNAFTCHLGSVSISVNAFWTDKCSSDVPEVDTSYSQVSNGTQFSFTWMIFSFY